MVADEYWGSQLQMFGAEVLLRDSLEQSLKFVAVQDLQQDFAVVFGDCWRPLFVLGGVRRTCDFCHAENATRPMQRSNGL